MPNSTASRSRAFTTSAPAAWPSATGRSRACAQRPLPSVMMATYRAGFTSMSLVAVGARRQASSPGRMRRWSPPGEKAASSNLEDLFLFALELGVELGDLRVGQLLQLLLAAALVVGADLAVVLE